MKIHSLAAKTAFFCLLSLFSAPSSWSDDFPGVGSRSGWSEALPHYNVANKYMARGEWEQAANHLEQAIGFYDRDPDFFVNYGVVQRKLENYSGAEEAFKKAIALRENDWESWSNLANAYLKQNRLQDTINCFNKAMKYNPPAAEKEAMLKDIADIKKILSMQAPPPAAANASTAKASTAKKAVNPDAQKPNASVASTKPPVQAKGATVPNTATNKAPSVPPDKEQLKNSGWDWVY